MYKKTELSSPWYRKFFKTQGKYDDIREIPGYIETINSLKKNILPIQDLNNLDMSGFEDYGAANGWTKETETPKLDKYNEDLRKDRYLCVLSWEESIGLLYWIHKLDL